jgi:hypothetical protein
VHGGVAPRSMMAYIFAGAPIAKVGETIAVSE